MFTGITQGLFPVITVAIQPGLINYSVELNDALLQGLQLGASISIDGVCQSVISIVGKQISFNAIAETCRKTTLAQLHVGQKVSIERSATMGSEIGGHVMAGHVYGMAEVVKRTPSDNNLQLTLHCNADMMPYFFNKGFVGINGSSLTINAVDLSNHTITVDLIPHTLQLTDLGNKYPGDSVNIELDPMTVTIVETVKRLTKNSPLPLVGEGQG